MSPVEALARVNATGGDWRLAGPLSGGEVGAYEVVSDRGERGVLKFAGTPYRDAVARSVAVCERLRGHEYPAPPFLIVCDEDDALITVSAWAPGATEERVDRPLVASALGLNAIQRAIAAPTSDPEPWPAFVERALAEGLRPAEGYCLHAPLAARDRRTRRLLAEVKACASAVPPASDGVAHCDFHHRNLLRVGRRITAVVDWDSARDGDPAFDLVTLAFCSAITIADPDAVADLWAAAAETSGPDAVRAYTAFLALRQVDWSIRTRDGAAVERWLDISIETLSATSR